MAGFSIEDLSYLKQNEWVVYRRAHHADIPEGCRIEYNTTDFWYWISTLPFRLQDGFVTPEEALQSLLDATAHNPVSILSKKKPGLSDIEKRRLHNQKVLRDYKIKPKK